MLRLKQENTSTSQRPLHEPPLSQTVLPTQAPVQQPNVTLTDEQLQHPDYVTISRLCHVFLSCLGKPNNNEVLDDTGVVPA